MKKYRKGIFVVVYKKTGKKIEYLILKRKLHWNGWEFPKGGKKFFESELMAVRREVKEEVGEKPIKIKKFEKWGKYDYSKKLKDRKNIVGQTFRLYSAEVLNKKIKIDKREHSGYKWVSYSEARKKLTYKNQKDCLKIVNDWVRKK